MSAPTGTIGFMMDCDTTGIKPDLALVKFKKLVGGGMIKIGSQTVPQSLIKLGYPPCPGQVAPPLKPRILCDRAWPSAGVEIDSQPRVLEGPPGCKCLKGFGRAAGI